MKKYINNTFWYIDESGKEHFDEDMFRKAIQSHRQQLLQAVETAKQSYEGFEPQRVLGVILSK